MCSAEVPLDAVSKEWRSVLPSMAINPLGGLGEARHEAMKARAGIAPDRARRNTRLKVSWLGMPCSSFRNCRRNSSFLARRNSPCPPPFDRRQRPCTARSPGSPADRAVRHCRSADPQDPQSTPQSLPSPPPPVKPDQTRVESSSRQNHKHLHTCQSNSKCDSPGASSPRLSVRAVYVTRARAHKRTSVRDSIQPSIITVWPFAKSQREQF